MLDDANENLLPVNAKKTPMLLQWLEAKRRAKDAILLFRMGDFYELFAQDAINAAPILELALTSRDKDKGETSVPMAGFPHHAAPLYIAKLVAAGLKVAICDQMENPQFAKGIVKRDITRIVTPGTIIDDDGLKPSFNNYLVAVSFLKNQFGIAALDISTGDFLSTCTESLDAFLDELSKTTPAEVILVRSDWSLEVFPKLEQTLNLTRACRLEYREKPNQAHARLKKIGALDDWFMDEHHEASIISAELILDYVEDTQGYVPAHIASPKPYSIDKQLMIDATSRVHLDLLKYSNEASKEGTLLWVMDETCTAMGARQLARWLLSPSTDLDVIQKRHDIVQGFIEEPGICFSAREALKGVYDLERLAAKVASSRACPRDMAHLRNSLGQLPKLLGNLQASQHESIQSLLSSEDMLPDVYVLLDQALVFEPPLSMKEGGIFRPGYDQILDEILLLSSGGRDQIAAIEQREREITGIGSLKVKYTRVFGYYIEITKTHLTKVPEHYRRKQTVATGERYVTPELMQLEELVSTAEVRRQSREAELFEALREQVCQKAQALLKTAHLIARLDALCSFAKVADERRYVRPAMLPMEAQKIIIEEGRHPIVELLSEKRGDPFVPNHLQMTSDERLLLITGPNMAGKSTIMRQAALIQLLAQAGSFVPAKSATVSICDRIFTRVGAADDLKHGRSTFMVEMTETAHILKHATSFSLVLLDEIGRGTSTFDGLSLAWAVAEHLHTTVKARTMFATHYHELVALSHSLSAMRNMQVAVREINDGIVFLYRLIPGAAEQSYGIHVARLAGLPNSVLQRAEEVLQDLESEQKPNKDVPPAVSKKEKISQLDLWGKPAFLEKEVRQLLKAALDVDVNHTTPLEALSAFAKLQILAKKIEGNIHIGT